MHSGQNLQPSGTNVDPKHVTLTWSKVNGDGITYDYALVPQGQPLNAWQSHGDNSVQVPDLAYNTSYAWGARAWRKNGSYVGVGWQSTSSFKTEAEPKPCGTDVHAGTDVNGGYLVDLKRPGEFDTSYELYTVKDRVVITDDNVHGDVLFDSGCTNSDRTLPLRSKAGRVFVTVVAHCSDSGGSTSWMVSVGCPR